MAAKLSRLQRVKIGYDMDENRCYENKQITICAHCAYCLCYFIEEHIFTIQ